MEIDFISPSGRLFLVYKLAPQQLGSKIVFSYKGSIPDVNKINIAIVGVLENRLDNSIAVDLNANKNYMPCFLVITPLRSRDIVQGNSIEDSYFAVKSGSCFNQNNNTDRN
jgi:hypothetical protein